MNERLEKICEKVMDSNTGRLFCPEELFAQYVEYYTGFDIEIDPAILEERINDFFEEGSASFEEFPRYTLKLDNILTKEDYDYFYQQLSDICKKIIDATDSEWLKNKIKNWLNLE